MSEALALARLERYLLIWAYMGIYIYLSIYKDYVGITEKKTETAIMGSYRDHIGLYGGYIGIVEKKMEATIMESKMETTILVFWRYIGIMEKENENHRDCRGCIRVTHWKVSSLRLQGFSVSAPEGYLWD